MLSKIVYLSSSIIPSRQANSIHVVKMSQALADAGHDVTLVSPNRIQDAEKGIEDVFEYYSVRKNFSVKYMPWLGWVRGAIYLYELFAVLFAACNRADLVYTRRVSAALLACLFRKQTILELHAPIQRDIDVKLFRVLIGLSSLSKVVLITNALEDHFRKLYPKLDSKLETHPDGADFFNVVENEAVVLRCSAPGRNVGYTGHLYEGKGMELIVPLAEMAKDYQFHIVGGTESDIAEWKARCAYLGNIHFYGYVDQRKVSLYLKLFDMVLLPNQPKVIVKGLSNKSEYSSGIDIGGWTSPLKMFEYMSAGKLILASDLTVLKEILVDGENSVLCKPENPEDWFLRLEELVADPSQAREIAANAKREFEQHYTWLKRAVKCVPQT